MQAWLGSHDLAPHGWLRLLFASALVLVLVLTLEASPAAGASGKGCRVTNTDTGTTYKALQAAVDAARPSDQGFVTPPSHGGWPRSMIGIHLVVKGTCHGGTVIDKDLILEGAKSPATGEPTLDGDGRGRVLTVDPGIRVVVGDLTIRNGAAEGTLEGGGILDRGLLTLRDVVVRNNRDVGLHNEGRLIFSGGRVRDNDGSLFNSGRLALFGTHVHDNAGSAENAGTLILSGGNRHKSGIHDNDGRGVYNTGLVKMWAWGSIYGNSDGGVYNAGTLKMYSYASIHSNVATTGPGGGVYNASGGTLVGVTCGPGGNVHGNTPDDCYVEP